MLFISAHDPEEGALGVIINRPLDKQVSDLVSEAPPQGLADVPVFLGGPGREQPIDVCGVRMAKGEGLKLNHSVGVDEASERVGDDPASDPCFRRLRRMGGRANSKPR